MINRWLTAVNGMLIGAILLLGIGTAVLWMQRPEEIVCGHPKGNPCHLPKSAFEHPMECYQELNGPLLALQQASPSLQLPDLRQQLIYYGKNGRPDAQSQHTLLHFSLNGNKAVVSIAPGERLYLVYDKKSQPGRYIFSAQNEPSSLWIEGVPVDSEVEVKLTMANDKGEWIVEPESNHQFRLPEKEFVRYAGSSWELGSWRVDGTILARQRARWFGPDRFLEKHGGEEYHYCVGKERVDFGENDDIYSVFVKIGDCLVWDQNRWKVVEPGHESRNHPLLVVKKVDERLMAFELWDVEGKRKILLNLLKSAEPWIAQNAQHIQHMFKFVGARTRSQCVFEINHERIIVRPSDWLLMTQKGWKKLTSAEEIDNYVKRKTPGTLFVFEGLTRKDERQVMLGTLYNPTRSDYQTVELALQPANSSKAGVGKENKEKEVKETKESVGVVTTEKGVKLEEAIQQPGAAPVPLKHQSSNQ